ncbi:hypothetical protein [Alteromonas sp. H39]|uniref:hypothetical protein n=1 Tax=Alteromonas sp. H39 TaxID=3389876 RepID=UPI0039DF7237
MIRKRIASNDHLMVLQWQAMRLLQQLLIGVVIARNLTYCRYSMKATPDVIIAPVISDRKQATARRFRPAMLAAGYTAVLSPRLR